MFGSCGNLSTYENVYQLIDLSDYHDSSLLRPGGVVLLEWIISATSLAIINHCLNQDRSIPQRLERVFANVGLQGKSKTGQTLKPKLKDFKQTDDYSRIVYYLPEGYCLNMFEQRREALEHILEGEVKLSCKHQHLVIECWSKELPRKELFVDYPSPPKAMKMPIPIGISRKGFIWFDITESPHFLVGGLTGFGKSSYLNYMITYLLAHQNVELYFCDFKMGGVEAQKFIGSSANTATNLGEAMQLLDRIENKLRKRASTIIRNKKTNWLQLKNKPPYIFLIVDEYASIAPEIEKEKSKRQIKQMLESRIFELASQARFCGFSLVICTQNPYREIIRGIIKHNIAATLAFKTRNEISSNVLLDNEKAAELNEKGRAIFSFGGDDVEVQIPFLDEEKVSQLLSTTNTTQMYSDDAIDYENYEVPLLNPVIKHPY